MPQRLAVVLAVFLMSGPLAQAADPPDVASAIAALKAVGKEGAGTDAAAPAWKKLIAAGSAALVPTLAAFDGASPVAANWLRTAVDAIAEAERKAGRKLPAEALETFITETSRTPAARRIAFELLTTEVPSKKSELLAKMIDDPSLELRRDAIAARIEEGTRLDKSAQSAEYQRLLTAARDPDQVEKLVKLLEPLGVKPDLAAHFGFVTRWHVIGPFDSKEGSAFTQSHLPLQAVELTATFKSKSGEFVGWKPIGTADPYGMIDLNKQLAKHKDAAVYAYAVVEAQKEQAIDLRAGTQNALQIYLNGTKVFEREEYHHGTKMDQHAGKGRIKAGRNELLIKVCQNDQKEEWAQVWGFQLRLCDAIGGAVPIQLVSPTAAEAVIPPVEPKKEKK